MSNVPMPSRRAPARRAPEPTVAHNVRLPAPLDQLIRDESTATGIPMISIIIDAIEARYRKRRSEE